MPYRIGQGYDVHALVPGRPLVLGGVPIPHVRGLLGHSDADALLHAITDALIGAAALGDIGRHFPDTDPRWRGVDSTVLLAATGGMLAERGWRIGNIDASIIAQAPRLAPFVPAMCRRIAEVLAIEPDRVNVKARTGERLGPVGRGECIEAQAIVLITRA
ncbi:MAG: 2-C-methyl-D-erythritol 2,4-cyclodiphosphate synthase [Burkholderiaceae bacterium]|nr:2-C-methyl-D-erythritol 2,4-cyclodiphosphate synthase [Gemmatimonadales bacterium]MCO5119863.1 2-C-methyl-D-erythritol 2,4-cyclodiphosphate synthase [Burkholderiaceae bacterium]MEB2319819.1 2-C-methyl-D-erythritol 2,4-cyclodiphosphate synthase [Pseudomonadota bacterium]